MSSRTTGLAGRWPAANLTPLNTVLFQEPTPCYSIPSKLTVLIAVVSIVLLAHSGPVSAQTYDWTNLTDAQLTSFSDKVELSVAISGDVAVVGDRKGNSNAGEVKLFSRVSAGNWNALATFTAGDATADDFFGYSVGISGDTVVVGAHGDDSYKGSAYVFIKPGPAWATTN